MNTTIKHILVPVDFSHTSEFAANFASAMAKLFHAKLSLIHIVAYNEFIYPGLSEANIVMPLQSDIEEASKKKLQHLHLHIKNNYGIDAHIKNTVGNIETEITDYAKEQNADLIIMGTHGKSGYKEVFLGSNAQRVVTVSDVPVLTINKERNIAGFSKVLLPIDDSQHSRQKVNIALDIAQKYNAQVHILGILDSEDETEKNKFLIKLKSVEDAVRAKGLQYHSTMKQGESLSKMALEYAEENKCDLIVINTGHESKITGMFLGAFAQQIVNHSKIPVLSVKANEDTVSFGTPGFAVE